MGKITVEIELEGYDSETGFVPEIQDQIISGVINALEKQVDKQLATKIAEKADKYISARIELLVNSILEKPITITEGWSTKHEYSSIYEMVEEKFTALYEAKLDKKSCNKGPLLTNIEKYIESSFKTKFAEFTKELQSYAAEHARLQVANDPTIVAMQQILRKQSKETTT